LELGINISLLSIIVQEALLSSSTTFFILAILENCVALTNGISLVANRFFSNSDTPHPLHKSVLQLLHPSRLPTKPMHHAPDSINDMFFAQILVFPRFFLFIWQFIIVMSTRRH
jgi:hypothetical protein